MIFCHNWLRIRPHSTRGSYRLNRHTLIGQRLQINTIGKMLCQAQISSMAILFASPNVRNVYEDTTNEKVSSEHERKRINEEKRNRKVAWQTSSPVTTKDTQRSNTWRGIPGNVSFSRDRPSFVDRYVEGTHRYSARSGSFRTDAR